MVTDGGGVVMVVGGERGRNAYDDCTTVNIEFKTELCIKWKINNQHEKAWKTNNNLKISRLKFKRVQN